MLSDKHPLAGNTCVSLAELKREAFLLMPAHTSIYRLCMQLFSEADFTPNILRTVRMESILSSIAIGEGISLLPEKSLLLFQHPNVISLPLTHPPRLLVGAARKKYASLSGIEKKKVLHHLYFWNF